MIIALLGAESTGKTTLAKQLVDHLCNHGKNAVLVLEWLRTWYENEKRTPSIKEQEEIAHNQSNLIFQASKNKSNATITIADTTALMTAVYSEFVLRDVSLYSYAIQEQIKYDITLLTGLDLPWVEDDQRGGEFVQTPVDSLIRKSLWKSNIPFSIIYGKGKKRLFNALSAIQAVSNNF